MNEVTLRQARDGIFPLELMQEYTQNYLHAGGQRVVLRVLHGRATSTPIFRPSLQRNIVFSQHNLVTDGRSTSSTSSCAAT